MKSSPVSPIYGSLCSRFASRSSLAGVVCQPYGVAEVFVQLRACVRVVQYKKAAVAMGGVPGRLRKLDQGKVFRD